MARTVAVIGLIAILGAVVIGRSAKRDAPTTRPGPMRPSLARVRGMTISCPRDGVEWGSDEMSATLRELHAIGVEWVAIHPYAGIGNDGTVRVWRLLDPAPRWITRPIREAHELGMKIAIKPHLGYWGSKFRWRGEIDFADGTERKRFFDQYRTWILQLAAVSRDADLFVVGTELDRFLGYNDYWVHLIRDVRGRYSGALTYAANWPEYERVGFWQACDFVGIQAYFPLVADGVEPTRANLDLGWAGLSKRLAQFSDDIGKPVLFTEIGYNRNSDTALRPWESKTGGEQAEEIQLRCLASAFAAIENEPRIVGAFLWKWFPGRRQPRNFSMQAPRVREFIKESWLAKKKASDRPASQPGR